MSKRYNTSIGICDSDLHKLARVHAPTTFEPSRSWCETETSAGGWCILVFSTVLNRGMAGVGGPTHRLRERVSAERMATRRGQRLGTVVCKKSPNTLCARKARLPHLMGINLITAGRWNGIPGRR